MLTNVKTMLTDRFITPWLCNITIVFTKRNVNFFMTPTVYNITYINHRTVAIWLLGAKYIQYVALTAVKHYMYKYITLGVINNQKVINTVAFLLL